MELILAGKSQNVIDCPEHSHSDFEIIITLFGKGKTIIGDREILVTSGSVTVIPPETPHRHKAVGKFSDMFIQFSDSLLPREVLSFRDETKTVETLSKMIYTNWLKKERNHKAISENLMGALYEYIIKFRKSSSRYDFVESFKNALALGLSNPEFSISDAAKQIGVSFDYMRHCFKEETGVTPLEYLTSLRIRQAKRCFRTNRTYSVSYVARLCGFSDQYYFSRCFKKITGISPKDYKNSVT